MASMPPTILETLVKQLSGMPLWIKQVIYAQLRVELEQTMSKATVEAFGVDHMLQLWVPELTRDGVNELDTPSGKLSGGLARVLQLVRFKKSVANITVINNWSLEQCSLYLRDAIEQDLLCRPTSGVVLATIYYLAGGIRLGEYLVKINRITAEQMDQALRTQKYIEESMGERTGIANVMINLGYIRKEDTEGILFLKEESKKPFQGLSAQGAQPTFPAMAGQQSAQTVASQTQAAPAATQSAPKTSSHQPASQASTASQGFPQQPSAPSQEPQKKGWGLFGH